MYKGIVKVYHEEAPKEPVTRGLIPDKPAKAPFNGLVLEVEVTAKTPEALIKKINLIMSTMEDDDE